MESETTTRARGSCTWPHPAIPRGSAHHARATGGMIVPDSAIGLPHGFEADSEARELNPFSGADEDFHGMPDKAMHATRSTASPHWESVVCLLGGSLLAYHPGFVILSGVLLFCVLTGRP